MQNFINSNDLKKSLKKINITCKQTTLCPDGEARLEFSHIVLFDGALKSLDFHTRKNKIKNLIKYNNEIRKVINIDYNKIAKLINMPEINFNKIEVTDNLNCAF